MIIRWLLDQDRWEYLTKLHLAVLVLLLVSISSALVALFINPSRWLAIACLVITIAGTYQTRVADIFLSNQEHLWDETKFPSGPPSFWMRNVTMDDSISLRARMRRQLFRNPDIGNFLIAVGTVLGVIAIFT